MTTELRPLPDPRVWQRVPWPARQRRQAQVLRAVRAAAAAHRPTATVAETRPALLALLPAARRDTLAPPTVTPAEKAQRYRERTQTPEQRRAQYDANNAARRAARAAETPEQREARLARERRYRKRPPRAELSPDEREKLRAKDREYDRGEKGGRRNARRRAALAQRDPVT